MVGSRKVQTLKPGLLAASVGVLLIASLLILPIQAITLAAPSQSGILTYGGSTRGRRSPIFLSWKDTTIPSDPLSPRDFSTMSATSSDDSNDMEVGVEWVNDYTFWQNLNGWGGSREL